MPLNLEQKQAVVTDVSEAVKSATALVTCEYRGMTVAQLTSLRRAALEQDVYLKVVQNKLAKRALADTDFASINDRLVGPLIYAFSEQPSGGARLVKDFAKTCEALQVSALSVSGKVYEAAHLDAVASLPTYDEAIAQLMAAMQAPTQQCVRTIAEPVTKFVRTLAAVRDAM